MDDATRARVLARLEEAHAELVAHLDSLGADAADGGVASALPDWTRGHVLTHVARNADSLVRVLQGVDRGESLEQYDGGFPAREAAIEAGAGRQWPDLVIDVRESAAALEDQVRNQRSWDGAGFGVSGAIAAEDVPFRRWREVLVHHADLGDPGYTAADWPREYVREELQRMTMLWNARLPMGAGGLPPEALEQPPIERLRWLLGRVELDGLEPAHLF